jgi:predicted glycogen debranching enzyme
MSYLKFDKLQLVNLEYSLKKEYIRSNRSGSYSSSTIVGCNTRKYHGLLVCPIDEIDGEKHVILSSLDLTVIQHDAEFNLGIHKFPDDIYFPRGHKYVREFEIEKVPRIHYRVGGVIVRRETVLIANEEQIILKYTLEDAHSPTIFRFKPFLAFRNFHSLSKANMFVNSRVENIPNGIKTRMYNGYPALHIQFSKKVEFLNSPDWHYNIEYSEEQARGYDYSEDLFVPGYFELPIKKGESIYISASLRANTPDKLSKIYNKEIGSRIPRDSFKNCLINAAQQFIVKRNKKTEITAGFHWFGTWGRDTFISLPGLSLAIGDEKTFKAVVDTMVGRMQNGLFPNMGNDTNPAFNSVDAPLWFYWSLQQYSKYHSDLLSIWEKYSKPMKSILDAYRQGIAFNIKMHENGLIWAGESGHAVTWMDAVIGGKPVTPRIGYQVEINALWYNAIQFCLELARLAKDSNFIGKWKNMPEIIEKSFIEIFWDESKGYLADYVDTENKDWSVRPNQIIAASLDYSPIPDDIKRAVIDVVKNELLTPRGLRTLSPNDPRYEGIYEGNQEKRDSAYHMGTAWPWLLDPFCRAYLKIYKKSGISLIREIYNGFEPVMTEYGIGSISEIYDGNPPHQARGAIAQAWSVAAVIQIGKMIEDFEKENPSEIVTDSVAGLKTGSEQKKSTTTDD